MGGWTRIRQIAAAVGDLDAVTDDLRTVLGLEVGHRDPAIGRLGLRNALLPVGGQFLELVTPAEPGTAVQRFLDRHSGDGGYMVILQCDDVRRRRRRVDELGIRVVARYDREDEGYLNTQLHPSDTGGSFLEIDQQTGEDPVRGEWSPAGHEWRPAVRTERVRGIDGAEMVCADPERVAARWSEILEIPYRHRDGHAVIPLDGGALRFLADGDRPEGLGGIDLQVGDGVRVREAAAERGMAAADGSHVLIGGLRMYLR